MASGRPLWFNRGVHLPPLIRDLALILAMGGLVSLLFQRIRQPVVLGYIIAGLIVGPMASRGATPLVSDLPSVRIWADIGVIFLMFSLGLEFSFRKLMKVGISAALTAGIEVPIMAFAGYSLGRYLGWKTIDAVFLGAMISISSTTIIVKALDEMGLKTRRFSEMIFAVLIVEDLLAVLILVGLSTVSVARDVSGVSLLAAAGQLVLVIGGWFLSGYFLVPRFVRLVGKSGSEEMLTIVSVGLCLTLVVFADHLGYSAALGAFIMGSILSESSEVTRIQERLEPLRDLFAAVFFVSVGMLIDPRMLAGHIGAILAISATVLIVKTTAVTLAAMTTGQTLRTSVQVGFGVAQIGEFSFIIAGLGTSMGATSPHLYPIAVAVSLITTFTTPYLIRNSHRIAVGLEKKIPMPMRDFMARYVAWTQHRRADSAKRKRFYALGTRWLLAGIMMSVVFVLGAELVLPWALERAAVIHLSRHPLDFPAVFAWLLSLVVAAPFFWAMLSVFSAFSLASASERRIRGGTLLLSRVAAVIWLSALSVKFFSARTVVMVLAVSGVAFVVLFYRKLDAYYRWIERQFLITFEPTAKSSRRTDVLRNLAPWDAHLVRIKVHPNSDLVKRTIAESGLRSKHGLNVVAIQRGLRTFVAPRADEMVLPKDELLVLGTDEQIERVRAAIERPPGLSERFRDLGGYELRQFRLADNSPLVGKSIRESAIRDHAGALVVGIERGESRVINPDSAYVLAAADILLIVGVKEQLDLLGGQI